MQHPRDGPQPVILWFGQLQRLLARFAEFIDEDPAEAGEGAAVVAVFGVTVGARAREGEQDFAGEAGDREHGGMARQEPG